MGDLKDSHSRTEHHSTLVQELTDHEKRLVEIISTISSEKASEIVLDTLDDRIVDIVYDRIAQEIGKSIIRKGLWAVGIIVVAIFLWAWSWLASKGLIK